MVTLAKGKQNVSACIFDVVMSCACALEPHIYNDCGNWSGPSTGLDITTSNMHADTFCLPFASVTTTPALLTPLPA